METKDKNIPKGAGKNIFISKWLMTIRGKNLRKRTIEERYELYEWAISRTVSVILWGSCCNFKGRFSLYLYLQRGVTPRHIDFFLYLVKKRYWQEVKEKIRKQYMYGKNDNLYKWSLLNSSTYKLFLHLKIEIKKLRRKCNQKREM